MFGLYLEVYGEVAQQKGNAVLLPLLLVYDSHDSFFSVLFLGTIPGKILVSLKKDRLWAARDKNNLIPMWFVLFKGT